jgi:hypothetical protein
MLGETTVMDSISFWLAALGLPIVAVVANSVTRWLADLPQSAPADMVLAFIVFDAIVVIEGDEFRNHVPIEEFRVNLTAIYVMYIFVGLISWAVSVFYIEKKVVKYYRWTSRTLSAFPFLAFFFSLFIPVMLIFASVTPFIYKG